MNRLYLGKKLLHLVFVILGLSVIVFFLMFHAPGNAATKKLQSQGIAVSREVIERTERELGLEGSFLMSYGKWLSGVLRGDMGSSYKDGKPVGPKIFRAMGYTLMLSLASLLLSLLVAVPLGILSAKHKDKIPDRLIKLWSFFGNAMPNFLIAIVLMYYLCIRFPIFSVISDAGLKGIVLPALSLAIPLGGRFIRQIRAEVLERMDKPYVHGLRSRGVRPGYIFYFNILRNSLGSLLTIAGLSFGTLLGGSVVTEAIYGWPGIGNIVMGAITARDYPVIQGFALVISIVYVCINLLTDIGHSLLDPRIHLQ